MGFKSLNSFISLHIIFSKFVYSSSCLRFYSHALIKLLMYWKGELWNQIDLHSAFVGMPYAFLFYMLDYISRRSLILINKKYINLKKKKKKQQTNVNQTWHVVKMSYILSTKEIIIPRFKTVIIITHYFKIYV